MKRCFTCVKCRDTKFSEDYLIEIFLFVLKICIFFAKGAFGEWGGCGRLFVKRDFL